MRLFAILVVCSVLIDGVTSNAYGEFREPRLKQVQPLDVFDVHLNTCAWWPKRNFSTDASSRRAAPKLGISPFALRRISPKAAIELGAATPSENWIGVAAPIRGATSWGSVFGSS